MIQKDDPNLQIIGTPKDTLAKLYYHFFWSGKNAGTKIPLTEL